MLVRPLADQRQALRALPEGGQSDAADVPTIPMYSRPNPLIYESAIGGMKNNPSNVGFTWNTEEWFWKS